MVLKEYNINQTFLLPLDIRTLIPDNQVCFFFIRKLVDCMDFNDIDFKYENTPGQKAYPAVIIYAYCIRYTLFYSKAVVNWKLLLVRMLFLSNKTGFENSCFQHYCYF